VGACGVLVDLSSLNSEQQRQHHDQDQDDDDDGGDDAGADDKLLAPPSPTPSNLSSSGDTPSNLSSSGDEPEQPTDAYKYQRRRSRAVLYQLSGTYAKHKSTKSKLQFNKVNGIQRRPASHFNFLTPDETADDTGNCYYHILVYKFTT